MAQVSIAAVLLAMASTDPLETPVQMAVLATFLGFFAASQDIVIDAYRIEIAETEMQGVLAAAYINGYRLGMLVAGAGALEVAGWLRGGADYSYAAWQVAYSCLAILMVLCTSVTVFAKEPQSKRELFKTHPVSHYFRFLALFLLAVGAFAVVFWMSVPIFPEVETPLGFFLVQAGRLLLALCSAFSVLIFGTWTSVAPEALVIDCYVDPVRDFFIRYGVLAILILTLIGTYRVADVVMGVTANIFYLDIGFVETDIGRVSGAFGIAVSIFGGFLAGVLIYRYGIMPLLAIGGALAAGTNILFAWLAGVGAEIEYLMLVICADNLSGSLATASFVAYLSALTSVRFTAMQYAIYSSLMLLIPKLIAGYSGMMSLFLGWEWFFTMTAVMGVPVFGLVLLVGKLVPSDENLLANRRRQTAARP